LLENINFPKQQKYKIMQTATSSKLMVKGVRKMNVSQINTKKSVGELAMQNIPDGKYKGLSSLLEPHEQPMSK
jgi:hypothetical protein